MMGLPMSYEAHVAWFFRFAERLEKEGLVELADEAREYARAAVAGPRAKLRHYSEGAAELDLDGGRVVARRQRRRRTNPPAGVEVAAVSVDLMRARLRVLRELALSHPDVAKRLHEEASEVG
jgi:hypothetical protein